jgi:hypothetical protein
VIRLLSDWRVRLGACVAALAILAGIGVVTHPPAPAPHTQADSSTGRAVVNRVALSCPAPGAGSKVQTVVDAVAPSLPSGTPTARGRSTPLSIGPLPSTAGPLSSLGVRGRLGSTPRTTKLDPLAVRGSGPLAAGVVATSTSTASEGVNRGMASVPCQQPGSDFWFVGASSATGRRDVLVLTNLDTVNAGVDVTVYSAGGRRDVPGARGIVVPARGTAEVYLMTVMPRLGDLALRVVSTGGRVSAALRDNVTSGRTPGGVDWLNPSAAPATKVVVPALAPGRGVRTLTVVNPGDLQATATITVHSPNGPFKPVGKSTLDIPAGAVRAVRLDPVLQGDPTAVTVTSDQPLTASARMIDSTGSDFASMGATEPLTGPAYLVLPPHSEPVALQLTAPDKRATVRFELRDTAGKVIQSRALDVVGGATSLVTFRPQPKATYLMVSPTRSTVVGGVTLMPPKGGTEDDVARVAAWPLTTSLLFRPQLGAESDAGAALK